MKIDVPDNVRLLVKRLNAAECAAYPVGGCIRDSIIGRVPKDWDVATSALPNKIKNVFSDFTVLDTGIEHGTVTVLIDNYPYEVTTFRTDGDYSDNRRPDFVEFVRDIHEDLSRRDFTINALAYDCDTESIIDDFGGAGDIKRGLIRCVGDAHTRFREDALRILRALRFASVLGFELDSKTAEAALSCRELLNNVSQERIFAEFKQLMCGGNVRYVLEEFREILAVIIPEIKLMFDCPQRNPYHCYNVWGHTVHCVSAVVPQADIRTAALFHDIGKPAVHTVELLSDGGCVDHFYSHAKVSAEIAASVLTRMKSAKAFKQTVVTLVKYHDINLDLDKKCVKRRLNKFGAELLNKLIELKRGDTLGQSEFVRASRLKRLDDFLALANTVIEERECFSVKDLVINGRDLIALGYSGREIGIILNKIVDEVINERLSNRRTELLKFAEKYLK